MCLYIYAHSLQNTKKIKRTEIFAIDKGECISGEMVSAKYFYLSFLRALIRKLEFTLS